MAITQAADGTALYYETHGTAGDPLLLISGQSDDHHMWDAVRADFSERHRVIVYDARGTGASDKPKAPAYTTRSFAADAVAVLDAVGVDRAHVYGISMGGRVGQWLAIDHPQRLGALVLGCTTPGDAHGVARADRVNVLMRATPTPQTARALLELQFTPEWIEAHPELHADAPDPMPAYARRLHYTASQGHDAWELLPSIAAPSLVIHGTDDELNPTANSRLLAERIPNAELRLIEGGRHRFFEEFRARASAVVLDFLAGHRLP